MKNRISTLDYVGEVSSEDSNYMEEGDSEEEDSGSTSGNLSSARAKLRAIENNFQNSYTDRARKSSDEDDLDE